jgi:SAM-dependent methyltransferase
MKRNSWLVFLRRLFGTYHLHDEHHEINQRIDHLNQRIEKIAAQVETSSQCQYGVAVRQEMYQTDLLLALNNSLHFLPSCRFQVETDHPVALESIDHLYPYGTAHDNTRHPRFVWACEQHVHRNRPLCYLDLGCAGGGLVLDFLLRGHFALGLEGSDYSLKAQRAEWRWLRDYLSTCDISHKFRILDREHDATAQFDVISAWEVLEHIAEEGLHRLLENIGTHLDAQGIFCGSISVIPGGHPEREDLMYHPTVQPKDWWEALFAQHGLAMVEDHGFQPFDFCRGTGAWPYKVDYLTNPDSGFLFVARKQADA